MRKFLQFICLTGVLLMLTQCATCDLDPMPVPDPAPAPEQTPDSEPTPDPDEETWQLTFDNCRRVLYGHYYYYYLGDGSVPEEYRNLTRNVTLRWSGDRFLIKGLFPDYPDAWVNGTVKDGKVFFETTQLLEETNGEQIYFHSGEVRSWLRNADRSLTSLMTFEPPLIIPETDYDFSIDENRNEIMCSDSFSRNSGNAFWLSKDEEPKSEFHTTWRNGKVEGTPFPDPSTCMMNMVFRKVSSSGVDVVRPDPK